MKKKTAGKPPVALAPHHFELDRATRRMVCRVCEGIMNECGDCIVLHVAVHQAAAASVVVQDALDPFESMFAEAMK